MLFTFEVFVNEIICLLKLNPAIFGFKTKVKNIGNIDRGCLISVKLVLQQCLVYCQCYFIYIVLLEFISFGYFCIPMVNKDLNKKKKNDSGKCHSGNCSSEKCPFGDCPFGELSVEQMSSGNCPSGKSPSWKCPSEKCPSGNCPRTLELGENCRLDSHVSYKTRGCDL